MTELKDLVEYLLLVIVISIVLLLPIVALLHGSTVRHRGTQETHLQKAREHACDDFFIQTEELKNDFE